MSAARSTGGFRTQPVLQGDTLRRNLSASGYCAPGASAASSGGRSTATGSGGGNGDGSGGVLGEGLQHQDSSVDTACRQPQGIENLGNTCYMNATLQVSSSSSSVYLFNIPFSAD